MHLVPDLYIIIIIIIIIINVCCLLASPKTQGTLFVFLPYFRLINCRFRLFRSSASSFSSNIFFYFAIHQGAVFSLLFSLPSSVSQRHHEEDNLFAFKALENISNRTRDLLISNTCWLFRSVRWSVWSQRNFSPNIQYRRIVKSWTVISNRKPSND